MNQTEMDIVNKVVSYKNDCESARASIIANFQTYFDMFEGRIKVDTDYVWKSRISMREVFKAIDTIHPIFMDMLFMQGNPFAVQGQDGALDDKQAAVLQRLMKFYIEKMEAYNTFSDFILEMLINGTAFAKIYFDQKKKTPVFEHISYRDIFVSSRALDIQKAAVVHRTDKSLEQLKKSPKGVYKNLDELEKLGDPAKVEDIDQAIASEQLGNIGVNDTGSSAKLDPIKNSLGEYEILEYWSADNSMIYTVAGGLVLIREQKNPFKHEKKPFLMCNYIRRLGTIWGIGVCELCENANDLLNTAVNQQVDNNKLANNILLIADREADIDMEQTKSRPGGIIYVTKEVNESLQSKIQQLVLTKINTGPEIALAIQEIQEVSGAGRMQQGTYESGAVRTTSQTRIIMAASQKRFIGKILTFEEMFLKPFVRIFYGLLEQYITKEITVNMLGEDGMQYVVVKPSDIARDLDFIPIGSRNLVEMEQAVHQMNNFLSVISADPEAGLMVNKRYLYQKIWNYLSPDHDGDKVILSDEDAKRAFEEKQALAQAEAMGGGQAPGQLSPEASINSINPSQPNMAGGVQ